VFALFLRCYPIWLIPLSLCRAKCNTQNMGVVHDADEWFFALFLTH
jgi:hypothetical protein